MCVDVTYLVELVRGLFPDSEFSMTRSIHGAPQEIAADSNTGQTKAPIPSGSAASLIDSTADALVFSGTVTDIKRLSSLLDQFGKMTAGLSTPSTLDGARWLHSSKECVH